MQFNFDVTLLPWIGKINKDFTFLVTQRLEQENLNLTAHQWLLLKKLNDLDGQPQYNLAFITHRDKTSLTRLVHTVERKGYVQRVPCTQDKRVNKVYLTDLGRDILQKALPVITKLVTQMENGVSKEEILTAIEILKKVRCNLERIAN